MTSKCDNDMGNGYACRVVTARHCRTLRAAPHYRAVKHTAVYFLLVVLVATSPLALTPNLIRGAEGVGACRALSTRALCAHCHFSFTTKTSLIQSHNMTEIGCCFENGMFNVFTRPKKDNSRGTLPPLSYCTAADDMDGKKKDAEYLVYRNFTFVRRACVCK